MADTNNVKYEHNSANTGLNMDSVPSQIDKGKLTYALNAVIENFDANGVNYQNEPGNELAAIFPEGFVLIGVHSIFEQNKHIFFITNPDSKECQIGWMQNNDGEYNILVDDKCLNFNINHPILKVVHKITKFGTEIYWTDGYNPRRYLDIDDIPKIIKRGTPLCNPVYTSEIDCNQLNVQPNFSIPLIFVSDILSSGNIIAGSYQFAAQYSDAKGNPLTSYYSVTNPTPIGDSTIVTADFNYPVSKSIVIDISNLDITGMYKYFNIAVIKTINDVTSVDLVGTYFIEGDSRRITYSGQMVIKLALEDVFEKYPYYEIANDLTTAQDILIWDQLTSIDRVNYQKIANKIELEWETWRIPANESYADEYNATNLRGYLRDEVYAFEIQFLLSNGKETDSFHIPGRCKSFTETLHSDVPDSNADFVGDADYFEGGIGYKPYWKVYNTAHVKDISPEYTNNENYKGPYQYGEFGYYESTETYPCNKDIWGDLAGKNIRHHKFPDVNTSPIFESRTFVDQYSMSMGKEAVFPIGVRVNTNRVKALIESSELTAQQKSQIMGFRILRGNRNTNNSIVGKGILRNVNSYEREERKYYFPNYPYNDLSEDAFINSTNNAYLKECESFEIKVEKLLPSPYSDEPILRIEYKDCNTNKLTRKNFNAIGTYNICSIGKPTIVSGVGIVSYGNNYDVWRVASQGWCRGWRVEYDDKLRGITTLWVNGFIGGQRDFTIHVRAGTIPRCVDYCNRCGIVIEKLNEVRSSIGCEQAQPLAPITDGYRQVFNSPETSFGNPFLGNILKVESVIYGAGKAHFTEVRNNAKYKLLSKEAQEKALDSAAKLGGITSPFDISAMFAAYQAYLTIYINGITRRNYAYSFNSIASYDYTTGVPDNLGIKQRNITSTQYIIPAVVSVDDDNVNNYQRESSVYIKTDETKDQLPFPDSSYGMLKGNVSKVKEHSRFTISDVGNCSYPGRDEEVRVVSYYASMKKEVPNQWGQMYSYEVLDTGFVYMFDSPPKYNTVFGGDTYISRFAFKTKVPFFIDNRVGALDDSDIFYDEIGNIGYPKYWHSARSILEDYSVPPGKSSTSPGTLVNIISHKAHNFDCPNDTSYDTTTDTTTVGPFLQSLFKDRKITAESEKTFYDGYFYLFAYGVPNFYCESSYNLDLRQAFNNREGDFFPHVSNHIPDDWLQESHVTIKQDNTYYYNPTFSKQNKENYFSHIPLDWDEGIRYEYYPFRAIYSDVSVSDADTNVNKWRIYRAASYFDFPQNYGKLTSLDGIENRAILARFENKTLLYGNLLTIDTSNPQAAYMGNPNLFNKDIPPIDFRDTDLGYSGSQHKLLLKIPQGQISIDAKRGSVFIINGTQVKDLSAFGSGLNRFLTDHLPFEILKYFPEYEEDGDIIKGVYIDNCFKGIGLHAVYDSKYERVVITKLDYAPIEDGIKYDGERMEFYIEDSGRKVVDLSDKDYFCNKSWTLSINMNTGTWISFHSYIPHFYIAETNFFYSGLNDWCSDFDFIVGELPSDFDCELVAYCLPDGECYRCELEAECYHDCEADENCALEARCINLSECDCDLEAECYYDCEATTTDTTCEPGDCDLEAECEYNSDDTTTLTTIECTVEIEIEDVDCEDVTCALSGGLIDWDCDDYECELEAECYYNSDDTTTIQECITPEGLQEFTVVKGYDDVDSTASKEDACEALYYLLNEAGEGTVVHNDIFYALNITIGETVYTGINECECEFADGWYFTDEGANQGYVFYVEDCIITEIYYCPEPSTDEPTTEKPTTSTSTTTIIGLECEFPTGYNFEAYLYRMSRPSDVPGVPFVDFTSSLDDACLALYNFKNNGYSIAYPYRGISKNWNPGEFAFNKYTCEGIPSGYYILSFSSSHYVIILISPDGKINAYLDCPEITTTIEDSSSTTTIAEEDSTTTSTTTIAPVPPQTTYGYLYNLYATSGVGNKSIANTGWHVPTNSEFDALRSNIGGLQYGYKLKETGTTYWNEPNTGATNELGFNARAAGGRGQEGNFTALRIQYRMHASNIDQVGGTNRSGVALSYDSEWLHSTYYSDFRIGKSVRLMKDSTTLLHGQTGTYVGNNGIIYPTICIGSVGNEQEWLSCNLEETKFRDGSNIPYIGNSLGDAAIWGATTSAAYCIYP